MTNPLQDKIRERLDAIDQTAQWLADGMGIDRKTIYTFKSLEDMSLKRILKISELLQFDFFAEFMKRGQLYSDEEIQDLYVKDPEHPYAKSSNQITATFHLVSSREQYKLSYMDLLDDIERSAQKHGFNLI